MSYKFKDDDEFEVPQWWSWIDRACILFYVFFVAYFGYHIAIWALK